MKKLLIKIKVKRFINFLLVVFLIFYHVSLYAKQIVSQNYNKRYETLKNYEKATALFKREKYKEAFRLFYEIWDKFEMKSMILYYLYLYVHNEKLDIKKNDKEIIKYFLLESKKHSLNREYITALRDCNKILILNKNSKNVNYMVEDINQKIKGMLYSRDSFSLADYHYAKAFNEYFANELDKFISDAEKCLVLDKSRSEIVTYLSMLKSKTKTEISDFFDLDARTFECITYFDNRQFQDFNKLVCKILSISEKDVIILSFLSRYLKLSNFEAYLKQMDINDMLTKLKERKINNSVMVKVPLGFRSNKEKDMNDDDYIVKLDNVSLALSNYRERVAQEKLQQMTKDRIKEEKVGIKNIEKKSYENLNKQKEEKKESEKVEEKVEEKNVLLMQEKYVKIKKAIDIDKRYLYGKTVKNFKILNKDVYEKLLSNYTSVFPENLVKSKKEEVSELRLQSLKKENKNNKGLEDRKKTNEIKNKNVVKNVKTKEDNIPNKKIKKAKTDKELKKKGKK